MTQNLNVLLSRMFLLGVLLSFAIGLNYLNAWTAPTQAPPNGNVPAPLNTGTGVQSKSGGLQMSSLDVIGATGASMSGGQLSFWSGAIVDPAYTIDMGPLDPGANNGIRFPDDTVQLTAGGGGSLSLSFSKYMHVQHTIAAQSAIGSGWVTRILNTDVVNPNNITGASRSGNQIILPAGTYYIEGNATAFSTGWSKNALYNVTDASYTLMGISMKPNGGSEDQSSGNSPVSGRFTIAGTKTFEFRTYTTESGTCEVAGSGTSVCADVKIWKLD